MINDIIINRLLNIDSCARDSNGNINEDNKLNQFIDDIITYEPFKPADHESYTEYDYRLHCIYQLLDKSQQLLKPPNDYPKFDYVSSAVSERHIQKWCNDNNVFITAGTGKGKNTFIKNHLLKFANKDNYIIIFENRESLLSQQKIKLILSIDPEAEKYHDIQKDYKSDNMFIFGKHRNIMLISYQMAALKLLNFDEHFKEFLSKVRYAVFDEAHYLIDDSHFNRGVNIIAEKLLKPLYPTVNTLMPNATKIFLSATMDELFYYLQIIGYKFNTSSSNLDKQFKDISYDCPSANMTAVSSDKMEETMFHLEWGGYPLATNLIVHIPTDYSYITPYSYTSYDDLIPKIKSSNDKWLIFIDSKSKGVQFCQKLNDECGVETAVFLNADNKHSSVMESTYTQLIENESLSNKVLITTSVIYNGVNIKDDELKNIVPPFTTVPFAKQMIGRKRLLNPDDKVNLYLPKVSEKELKKRFKKHLTQYFDFFNIVSHNRNGFSAAINQMCGNISNFAYVVPDYPDNPGKYVAHKSLLANVKLHFDTMFELMVLQRIQNDENAYIRVVLEHLEISDKFDELIDITPLTEEELIEQAKSKFTDLLEQYVDNHIVDVTEDGSFTKIPEFTASFNSIYFKWKGENFDNQWKNNKRTVASHKFNNIFNELRLPYEIEISDKDKATNSKILTVKRK